MTDEDLARLLRPRYDWLKLVLGVLALLGTGWAVAQFLGSRASREEFSGLSEKMTSVQIDARITNQRMAGIEQAVQRLEAHVDRIQGRLEEQPVRRK